MATIFLEPGGDADFNNLLWPGLENTGTAVAVATDFVHGGHVKSLKYAHNGTSSVTATTFFADAGGRISHWFYWNTLPAATCTIFVVTKTGLGATVFRVRMTSAGIVQLWETSNQIGSNGATLATGGWHRISVAYTITSTTVNSFKVYVDGTLSITATNVTITNTGSSDYVLGNASGDGTMDMRSSDHYIDNSSSLTDTGTIWVTAKRPFANGTTNGFTTQIGSGGSGYGSGHAPQVNERPLSTTNGWSMVGAGSAITEEYTIEGASVGDIDISAATLVDFMGWVDVKALAAETGKIIIAGASSNISVTTAAKVFTAIAGSTSYPSGGTDIGVITSTTLTTFSLYEGGVVFAYIPTTNFTQTTATKSRIQAALTATQSTLSRISNASLTATTTTNARIQKAFSATQTTLSRIANSFTQTTTTKSRIQVNGSVTSATKSRVQNTESVTQTTKSRIQKTESATQPTKSRIQINATQTTTTKSRIQKTLTATTATISHIISTVALQTTKSRIQALLSATQTTKSRIQHSYTSTTATKSRIQNSYTSTTATKARIQKAFSATTATLTRIQKSLSATQATISRVQKLFTATTATITRIQKLFTSTTSTKSRIQNSYTATQPTKSRIQKALTATQNTLSRVQKLFTQTTTTKTRIQINGSQIQSTKSRVQSNQNATTTTKSTIIFGVDPNDLRYQVTVTLQPLNVTANLQALEETVTLQETNVSIQL